MPRSPKMVQAIEMFECPVCGSPKGEDCLYTDEPEPTYRVGQRWERYLKNGTPMVQLHMERLNKVWTYEARQQKKAADALRKAQEPPPIPRDLLESLRRWDYEEWRQIRIWLHLHAHILWDP